MPKIISIHSYRGGTGKSNSTANLATVIALAGNRVGIVDTDIQAPGIHVLFNLQEEQIVNSLNKFLWGQCSMVDAAYDVTSILGDHNNPRSKIYLVPSSAKLNDISRILREGFDVEMLFEGFQELIKKLDLDYLFIDTHPGLSEETLLSLTLSDIVIIVLRPDKQDFQGSAVTIDVAHKLKVPKLFILVNKALAEYNFTQMRQQIEKTYNTPVVGILPESRDMIRLASRGVFCLKYPSHPISKVIKEMAQQIMG